MKLRFESMPHLGRYREMVMSTILATTARKGTMPRLASAAGLCLVTSVEGQDQGRFASIAESTLNPWHPLSYRQAKPEGGQKGG